jgi:hypothetical protein
MYNTDLPNRADLPSSGRLLMSTLLAAVAATAILVTTVLPADYGIDPTGVGRVLGLTDMGETKARLAAEAEEDRKATASIADVMAQNAPGAQSGNAELAERMATLERAVLELVQASKGKPVEKKPQAEPTPEPVPEVAQEQAPAGAGATQATEETQVAVAAPAEPEPEAPAEKPKVKSNNVSFVLEPNQGIEVKLVMKKNAEVAFAWFSEGGPVNFDTHADGPGQEGISYEKGRGVESKEGVLKAAYDGNHGWFWRNRGSQNVKLTLKTKGEYSDIKGVP